MKKLLCLIIAILTVAFAATSCTSSAVEFGDIDFSVVTDMSKVTTTDKKTDYVLLDVADYGQILIRLYPDVAPKTVKNFKKLVADGFYDGLIFHRVIEDFVIQGGDPKGDGTGGSSKTIKGEFNENGVRNNLRHIRGVVSMARSNKMDSASSQFFICHADANNLNGKYASFGFVVSGMDVVDKIAAVDTSSSDKPYTDVVITSAKFANVPESVLAASNGSSNGLGNIPDNDDSNDQNSQTPDTDTDNNVQSVNFDFSEILNENLVSRSLKETDYVCIELEEYGKIYARLFPETAPITVANFKSLVSDKFYDGLTFHRVIEDFMIQGGDPNGDGTGGSDKTIKGEFSSNGVENPLSHKRGVLSMARLSYDMDSASSQFFICQRDFPSGDGDYASFGYVIKGMNVVDKIAQIPTDQFDAPLRTIKISSVYFVDIPAASLTSGIESLEGIKETTEKTNYVSINVKDYGKIVVRLYPDIAPLTVANFQKLVSEGFYDGLTFHRAEHNFMILGGDPNGDGTGTADSSITGEFALNGIENNLSHVAGVISMARLIKDYNSASCQFFICHGDTPSLNGKYAGFGYVIYGFDVVDAIAKAEVNSDFAPINDIVIESIKFLDITEK